MTLRVLVTNDDGIYAPGLWALAQELVREFRVYVVAPDREQSAIGAAISLNHPIRVNRLPAIMSGDMEAYSVEGTPGDCVIMAINSLFKDGIDCVVSGLNEGSNLGNDVLISGTVGAALHGYFLGRPAFALSINSLRPENVEPGARLARLLVRLVAQGQLPEKILLNINLPDLPLGEIRGIEVTHLARRSYTDIIEEHVDRKGRSLYWITRGKPVWEEEAGSDIWAIRQSKVSITPLEADVASREHIDLLRRLAPDLFSGLLNLD